MVAIFKCIFLDENVWISIKISLKFVPNCPIDNIPALVQIMACHRPDNKSLSEPMMVSLLMHICVTRPQWVKLNAHTKPALHNKGNRCMLYLFHYFSICNIMLYWIVRWQKFTVTSISLFNNGEFPIQKIWLVIKLYTYSLTHINPSPKHILVWRNRHTHTHLYLPTTLKQTSFHIQLHLYNFGFQS